ncbi:unnamed protein product [Lymnaea stagnalis]|uniref:Receptor for retinol uptake STRA6 n=1 Tax=Lymnaea stagnalis TaxID=6523 RepID=A0AAV2HW00_LYMST
MGLDDFNIHIINYWILIPVACIILFLSFLEKRKCRPDICNGRPSLIIPIPFLDGYENRLAYSVAFGTITNTFVSLVLSVDTLGFDIPLWGRALYVYLQAFIGCLTCFPLVACLSTRYRAIGAIICILYCMTWLSLSVVGTVHKIEQNETDPSSDSQISENVMDGVNMAESILLSFPGIICYMVLIGYCIYILHRCIVNRTLYNTHTEGTVRRHQVDHVRWVFRKSLDKTQQQAGSFVERMQTERKLRLITNFPFFKYPTKMCAIVFVQLIIIYWLGVAFFFTTIKLIKISNSLRGFGRDEEQFLNEQFILLSICSSVAVLLSVTAALIQIFMSARNYRYHMLWIFQGRKDFAVQLSGSSHHILTSSMVYPGYQVGFMMWGCVLNFICVFLMSLLMSEVMYVWIWYDSWKGMFLYLAQILSFPAIMLIFFYLQIFVSKRVLLQNKIHQSDEYPPLNIDNRKLYEIINYYSIFTNMAVGMATCLLRIFQSALFSVFSVGRLDISVFTRDMESFDKGYKSYLSMLLVDNAHNNPSMRVFAHLLWTKTLTVRSKHRSTSGSFRDTSPLTQPVEDGGYRNFGSTVHDSSNSNDSPKDLWGHLDGSSNIQIRTRWLLAYTLIHNPQLSSLRKHALRRSISGTSSVDESIEKAALKPATIHGFGDHSVGHLKATLKPPTTDRVGDQSGGHMNRKHIIQYDSDDSDDSDDSGASLARVI